jgi:hypothetical protein
MQKIGPRLGQFGAILNLLLVVIIILMIWKPGF